MTGILIVLATLVAAMTVSEVVLHGTKLQTGLARILAVWLVAALATLYLLGRHGDVGLTPLAIFWGGAFLTWFGVRSHIESSILLRMLYLLRHRRMTEDEWVQQYEARYGHDVRVRELVRGRMVSTHDGRLSLTGKGRAILRIVTRLR